MRCAAASDAFGWMACLRRFAADDNGATSIEYALLCVIMGVGIIAGIVGIAPALNNQFNRVSVNFATN